MRIIWKGKWKGGEITIEAESMEQLKALLEEIKGEMEAEIRGEEYPVLSGKMGCSEAIRGLLSSDWGKEPRTMREIMEALQRNALYFSKGSVSGTLTRMTKRGSVRRVKKGKEWAYILA